MSRFLTGVTCIFLTSLAIADDNVHKAEAPDWVVERTTGEFAETRDGQFQLGMAYLLTDTQLRKTDEGYDFYERHVYKVVDRSGLEQAATIVRVFDPANSTLTFNSLRVIRDGQIADRLQDVEITVLRQEEGLGANLIDGNLTAVIQLEDVRVGDVIDYAISANIQSPLWPDEFFDLVSVEWSVPLAQMYYSLSVPEDMQINTHSIATELEPSVTTSAGWKTFEISRQDPEPKRPLQDAPDDYTQFGYIVMTTMDTWSDVVDWALPVFAVEEPLPAEFIDRLDNIADEFPAQQDQARSVLRLVQEDIRYLGIEVGLGSHVPRPPSVTLDRGYGDCKDKSVLLIAALNHLGIEAVPALASISNGRRLDNLPPMIDGFDHVVVQVDVDGQTFWVDPTLSHQGGTLSALSPLDYGYILPIREQQDALINLEVPFPGEPLDEISETFLLPDDEDGQFVLSYEYTNRGVSADFTRLVIANSGLESISRSFLDYYASRYPGISESEPLTIEDDMDNNVVVYRGAYTIDAETFKDSELRRKLPIAATAVQDMLPQSVEADRTAPLRLPYGASTRHSVRIETPGRMMYLPGDTSESVAGIKYDRKFTGDGETFQIDYTLAVTAKVAELPLVKPVTDLADTIAEESDISLNVYMAVPTLSRQLELATPLDMATEKEIMRLRSLAADGHNIEALTGLNSLLDEYDEPTQIRGYLQLQKAMVLRDMDREGAAMVSFDEAFDLYEPAAAASYFQYVSVLGAQDEYARASTVIAQMLEKFPDAVDDVNVDWMSWHFRRLYLEDLNDERDELYVAFARALHTSQSKKIKDLWWVFPSAIESLCKDGDRSEALLYLDYVDSPTEIADLLTNKETAAIWDEIEDRWGADLDDAFSAYVDSTRALVDESPDDYKLKTRHLEALRMAGQLDEAQAYAAPVIEDWSRIEAVGEDAYWFVNEYAYVLSERGSPEEAFDFLTRLQGFGVRENGALVSMAINHLELLQLWGRFEATLEGAEALEAMGSDVASDFGWMWIYESKACSLYQLQQIEQAEAVLAESIMPIADENPAAYTKALLCMDKLDRAAEVIIERLQDDDDKGYAIRSFVDSPDPTTTPPFLVELKAKGDSVRLRPEVQKAFDKVGRVISTSGAQPYWGTF